MLGAQFLTFRGKEPLHSVHRNLFRFRREVRGEVLFRQTCPTCGKRGKDQMRKTRGAEQEFGPEPGGEAEAQGAAPDGFWEKCAESSAGTTEKDAIFLAPWEEEDGPAIGPCERGISTQETQSPQTLSLLPMPESWGASPTGRHGPSSHRPFWAYSSAMCPCAPMQRTISCPGNALTARHTDTTAMVHLVQTRIIDFRLRLVIRTV